MKTQNILNILKGYGYRIGLNKKEINKNKKVLVSMVMKLQENKNHIINPDIELKGDIK